MLTTDPVVRAMKQALFRLEAGEINLSRFYDLVVEASRVVLTYDPVSAPARLWTERNALWAILRDFEDAAAETVGDREGCRCRMCKVRKRARDVLKEPRTMLADDALIDAMWQLLDDMGPDGLCVCQAAKEKAMAAYRAAMPGEPRDDWPGAFETESP